MLNSNSDTIHLRKQPTLDRALNSVQKGFPVLCLVALYASSVFVYSARPFWAYVLFTSSAILVIGISLTSTRHILQRHHLLALVYSVTLFLCLILAMNRSPYAFLHFGMSLLTFSLAFAVVSRPDTWLRSSQIVLISFQFAICIFLLTSGFENFPFERILPGASSNVITSSIIVLQINYMGALFFAKGRIATLTTLSTLFICVVGYGRASMLTALLLMALVTVYPLPFNKRPSALLRKTALMIVSVYVSLFGFGILPDAFKLDLQSLHLDSVFSELNKFKPNTKLAAGLRDDARELMVYEYLNGMNIWGFVSGQSYDGMSIKEVYNGNPHNSYIRAHHIFGLLYGLILMGVTLVAIKLARPAIFKVFLSSLLLIMLFRGTTETLIFPTVYDIVFFSLCIAMLESTKGEKRGCKSEQKLTTD